MTGQKAAAVAHQRLGQTCHAYEGMAGNIHGLQESAAGAVQQKAAHFVLRRAGQGVNDEVQFAPLLADAFEQRLEFAGPGHVQRQSQTGLHLFCQWLDMHPGLVVKPGECQFRAHFVQRLGAAPGDRMLVGDAHHQTALAGQR